MWKNYLIPASLEEALSLLEQAGEKARLVAGATDLMLEMERGVRKGVDTLIDITRIKNLDSIRLTEGNTIHIGPLVTHNSAAASKVLHEYAFPLVSACWQVGAPQIRNRATIAGNLITASPANDTITPLMALGAWVRLVSSRQTRNIPLSDFYTGVRKTVMQPDEILVDISFPALSETWKGTFLKLGLRRAQAISLVNTSVILDLIGDTIQSAVITLGAVAPTIIRAPEAEAFLAGKILSPDVINQAGDLAAHAARPIDDIRGSAAYRKAMVRTLVMRALRSLGNDTYTQQVPAEPILLTSKRTGTKQSHSKNKSLILETRINGKQYSFPQIDPGKSLLRLLREDAGLTGTKEGCAEGECGACTVFLDGKAVMACLVPAPTVNGSEIITIEGLSGSMRKRKGKKSSTNSFDTLHPVQQAFIQTGAVQCGYCTPGFIMAGAKLLEEQPDPTKEQITQALTGNLCRCTGYYKIVQAVEEAARL